MKATVRSLDLVLVVVVVNYLYAKETTELPEVSTAKGLEVDDGKVVGVGGSDSESPPCWIRLDHPRC